MPRRSRIDTPGSLHHIMCRGIEKRKVFDTNADREHFLERLSEMRDDRQ
jgi:putative transposase